MTASSKNEKPRRQVGRRLNHLDAIRVATWFQENKQLLNDQNQSPQQTSEAIEKALGIAVTYQTVERIGRSIGIKFQAARASRLGSVLTVANAVAALYCRLGEPVPEDLAELLGRADDSGAVDGDKSSR